MKKDIVLRIHSCGFSPETFTEHIMISKPFDTIMMDYSAQQCNDAGITTISNLISYIKHSQKDELMDKLGDFGFSNFDLSNIYVRNKEYLWGLQCDKSFTELFIELAKDFLEFDCFCVFGGASRECCGYLFIVHPDETIHVYSPHVHVKKDGVSTRYDLETFKRYPEDKVTRAHIRDEKKVIVPFLKANKEWLQEKWNLAMLGYIPPIEDEQGKQFCNES